MATAISTAVAADDVQTLYGYQLSVPQWGDAENKTGFVSFTSTDYAKLNFLKTTTYSSSHLSAGEYVDGKIYGYTIEWSYYGGIAPVAYVTYDANTYAELSSKSWEDKQRVLDMTYDYTTNTMYALAEDNVAVLGKERRQMFLSVLPFVWGQFSVIFKIIRSKFCHCQILFLF